MTPLNGQEEEEAQSELRAQIAAMKADNERIQKEKEEVTAYA